MENINETLADELIGYDALDQVTLDEYMLELDGTPNRCDRAPMPSWA